MGLSSSSYFFFLANELSWGGASSSFLAFLFSAGLAGSGWDEPPPHSAFMRSRIGLSVYWTACGRSLVAFRNWGWPVIAITLLPTCSANSLIPLDLSPRQAMRGLTKVDASQFEIEDSCFVPSELSRLIDLGHFWLDGKASYFLSYFSHSSQWSCLLCSIVSS